MPQMMPMNWTLLFYMFIFMYMCTIILNYYIFIYNPKLKMPKKLLSKKNWKW